MRPLKLLREDAGFIPRRQLPVARSFSIRDGSPVNHRGLSDSSRNPWPLISLTVPAPDQTDTP